MCFLQCFSQREISLCWACFSQLYLLLLLFPHFLVIIISTRYRRSVSEAWLCKKYLAERGFTNNTTSESCFLGWPCSFSRLQWCLARPLLLCQRQTDRLNWVFPKKRRACEKENSKSNGTSRRSSGTGGTREDTLQTNNGASQAADGGTSQPALQLTGLLADSRHLHRITHYDLFAVEPKKDEVAHFILCSWDIYFY